MVSTLRCGRNDPGSNPGHGSVVKEVKGLVHAILTKIVKKVKGLVHAILTKIVKEVKGLVHAIFRVMGRFELKKRKKKRKKENTKLSYLCFSLFVC